MGVPGDWASLLDLVVVCDCDELGPAEAPPEGLVEVVDVVGGAWVEVDVVVVDGVVIDEVVVADDDELLVVVAGEVWAAPVAELLEAEPPQPATTRISVSAARARVSFEVKACLLPGQAELGPLLGA